jgi:hypothetical protein
VTSPNGGECLQKGSTQQITWTSSPEIDKISILANLKTSAGSFWVFEGTIPNTGSYSWTVPSTAKGGEYRLKIIGYHTGVGGVSDESDSNFTIY